ncbi:MAG TPA: DUF4386 domain-containing protein [Cyclobacteriaceae bacterium]|nr:DUF4386 domain-containing protein [Cyclobacteriaceae bacterium]
MKTISSSEHKRNAKVTGAFFIAATVTAIIGLKLYDPILLNSDFLKTGVINSNQIVLGAIFESLLAISAVGTAIMMFPYLKRFNESWGLGYVCFRLIEVIFILIGILSMISIVTLSQKYISPTQSDLTAFQNAANMLKTIHDWTFVFGPHFMLGINTFIYSTIFYKSNLVPKKLSILGITGAVMIFIGAMLELFGIISPFGSEIIVIALPIAFYEMILAGWLIAKGFNLNNQEPAR